jgi:hypothetical protein
LFSRIILRSNRTAFLPSRWNASRRYSIPHPANCLSISDKLVIGIEQVSSIQTNRAPLGVDCNLARAGCEDGKGDAGVTRSTMRSRKGMRRAAVARASLSLPVTTISAARRRKWSALSNDRWANRSAAAVGTYRSTSTMTRNDVIGHSWRNLRVSVQHLLWGYQPAIVDRVPGTCGLLNAQLNQRIADRWLALLHAKASRARLAVGTSAHREDPVTGSVISQRLCITRPGRLL